MKDRAEPEVLIEDREITDGKSVFWKGVAEIVFRYCTIQGFSVSGGQASGAFLSCNLKDIDVYWGIFNCCIFVECRFENCTFRGTAFSGSKFVECKFTGCNFVKDNLGGDCDFDDAKWYECKQSRCVGLPDEVPST